MTKSNLIAQLAKPKPGEKISTYQKELTSSIMTEIHYFLIDSCTNNDADYLIEFLENNNNLASTLLNAVKNLFTNHELRLLVCSNTDSRNYLIAYKKLYDYFRTEAKDDKGGILLTNNQFFKIIFRNLSYPYEDKVDPRMPNFVDACDKKHYKDYNKIQELFIK